MYSAAMHDPVSFGVQSPHPPLPAKETGSCIAAEYVSIPSVIIAGPGFVDQAKCTALNNGVAVLRCAEYPGAFALHTEAELLRNTREVLWPQIVEALTKPITAEEIAAGAKGSKEDGFLF